METVLEFLVVLPSAVMVVVGTVRGLRDAPWQAPVEWRPAAAARAQVERRLVLVHDSAREKLLRSGGPRPNRAAARIRLVYNGG